MAVAHEATTKDTTRRTNREEWRGMAGKLLVCRGGVPSPAISCVRGAASISLAGCPVLRRGERMAEIAPPTPDPESLLEEARAVAAHAHAPYSRWHVGAAAVFAEAPGVVHRGANVENGSFGLTICAERAAICAGVAAGHRRLGWIALTCRDADGRPVDAVVPCGACLQVIAEFGHPDTVILIDGGGTFRLADFLPRPFVY
jgi:cytidine deaminase